MRTDEHQKIKTLKTGEHVELSTGETVVKLNGGLKSSWSTVGETDLKKMQIHDELKPDGGAIEKIIRTVNGWLYRFADDTVFVPEK